MQAPAGSKPGPVTEGRGTQDSLHTDGQTGSTASPLYSPAAGTSSNMSPPGRQIQGEQAVIHGTEHSGWQVFSVVLHGAVILAATALNIFAVAAGVTLFIEEGALHRWASKLAFPQWLAAIHALWELLPGLLVVGCALAC